MAAASSRHSEKRRLEAAAMTFRLRLFAAKRRFGKVEEQLPIRAVDRVRSVADVIAERAADQFAVLCIRISGNSLAAEQFIDRARRLEHIELPWRVRPLVFLAARKQHRPRGAERDE